MSLHCSYTEGVSPTPSSSGSDVGRVGHYFGSIHGDIYLWRIGEITAEQALQGIAAWMDSVEAPAPEGMQNAFAALTKETGNG